MKVKDVMTKDLITIRHDNRIKDALETFAKHNISCCPVLGRKNKLMGIVSQTDIIKTIDVHSKIHKTKELFPLIATAVKSKKYDKLKREIKYVLDLEIGNLMKKEVITIGAHEDIYTAAKFMNKHDINHLPVVDKNRLVGIISKSDLIKILEKL